MRPYSSERTVKCECFKERVIYIRDPSALSTGILCAFRETDVTRQLILKIPIIRPPPRRFVARNVIYLGNLPHLSGAPLELFSRPRHGRARPPRISRVLPSRYSFFLSFPFSSHLGVIVNTRWQTLRDAKLVFTVNCVSIRLCSYYRDHNVARVPMLFNGQSFRERYYTDYNRESMSQVLMCYRVQRRVYYHEPVRTIKRLGGGGSEIDWTRNKTIFNGRACVIYIYGIPARYPVPWDLVTESP